MITRLSERQLATLYDQCQAPVRLHMALHGDQGLTQEEQVGIESILRFNPPDLALISLGLCAVVLAEALARNDNTRSPLATEMKYLGIESVESFGAAYLGEGTGLENLEDLLELCPIHLCALGSVFDEIGAEVPFAQRLSEIAYDQADRAEALLSGGAMPEHVGPVPAESVSSNVVPLDLFAAWRKQKEPAE